MTGAEITRSKIIEYKNLRSQVEVNRGTGEFDGEGEPVKVKVKIKASTINRELACSKHMLKLAADEGLLAAAPVIKLSSESSLRVTALLIFKNRALLDASPRYFQRAVIGLFETGMGKSELLNLI